MSINSKLDSILKRMSKNADALDASTKNIANATARITYEVSKGQSVHAQYNLPKEKYEQVIDFTQSVVNICSKFIPPKEKQTDGANTDGDFYDGTSDVAADAARFESFTSHAEQNLDKYEKEIIKLNSLREMIHHIAEQ